MSLYTFYLKNGQTFKVKGEDLTINNNNLTGEIVGFNFSKVENFFGVDLNEVVAIVKDLEEESTEKPDGE